jgi:hypothetical protein
VKVRWYFPDKAPVEEGKERRIVATFPVQLEPATIAVDIETPSSLWAVVTPVEIECPNGIDPSFPVEQEQTVHWNPYGTFTSPGCKMTVLVP